MRWTPLKFLPSAWLTLSLVVACGDDSKPGPAPEPPADIPELPDSGVETEGGDAGAIETGPCIPKGCEELGYECGIADDGCGGELDCTGVKTCEYPETCGPDNVCSCIPKTCAELGVVLGATACGRADDGCGKPLECGACDGVAGRGWQCNESADICECAPQSQAAACEGRACGKTNDGCGGDVTCGSCGPARSCSDAGACACQPPSSAYAATACGGKVCGTVVVDGCEFRCGPACATACTSALSCVADACECPAGNPCNASSGKCCAPSTQEALCAARGCGETVSDPCTGATYTCGCGAGTRCVDKAYIQGATASRCIANDRAALLGGYVARTHSFTGFFSGLQRAESVSLVKFVQTAGGGVQIQDTGCVAQTVSGDETASTKGLAQAFFKIPAQAVNATLPSPTAFGRPSNAVHETTGFTPGLPTFCDGTSRTPTAGADTAAYPHSVDSAHITPSSGSKKAWLTANGGACTCPIQAETCTLSGPDVPASCLPKGVTSSVPDSKVVDCRINDIDEDGHPGFSLLASAVGSTSVTAVTVSNTLWEKGEVSASGFLVAENPADPDFIQVGTSCNGLACLGLGGVSQPCRPEFNRVYFAKLSAAADAQLTCAAFYNAPLSTVAGATSWSAVAAAVKQSAIESYFNGTAAALPTCAAGNACPTGMLCKAGSCYPKTSQNACMTDADCGMGWTCLKNAAVPNACWPVANTCK